MPGNALIPLDLIYLQEGFLPNIFSEVGSNPKQATVTLL
jgi:hypothetical protein